MPQKEKTFSLKVDEYGVVTRDEVWVTERCKMDFKNLYRNSDNNNFGKDHFNGA